MHEYPPEIQWFINLYSAHFDREFPRFVLRDLNVLLNSFVPYFGHDAGPIISYVLTRMWNKNDPEAIVNLVTTLRSVVLSRLDLLADVWSESSTLFGEGLKAQDKRIRAFGELIIHLMENGDSFKTKEDMVKFLESLVNGL